MHKCSTCIKDLIPELRQVEEAIAMGRWTSLHPCSWSSPRQEEFARIPCTTLLEKYINLQFCPVKAACYLLGIVSRTAWSSFSNFSNLPFPVYGPISTFHSRNTRPVSARAVLFLSPSSPKTVSQPTSLLETGSQPSNTFRHSTLAREREMEARQDMTSTGSTISEKFFFLADRKNQLESPCLAPSLCSDSPVV